MVNVSLFACPVCGSGLKKNKASFICRKNHNFKIKSGVPVLTNLNPELEVEAKAWEDDWKKGVSRKSLSAYRQNMKIFKKLGFWEESGEAAGYIPSSSEWTVLDLGCGNGVSTANIKGKNVIGLDLSERQLIRAKKKFPDRTYILGDATALPFKKNSFDLIVAVNVLHHLGNKPHVAIRECYRVLKKGGRLLTVDPNAENPIGFVGRGLFRILNLKKIFPTIPQFALQEDEYQFTKGNYYKLFRRSPFKKFKIIPHRMERILFFASVLMPFLANLPGYESLLIFTSKIENSLVKVRPLDRLCYFWKGEAVK